MKFNDIELPADLQDKDKGSQIISDNNEIILNLDEEYNKIRVRGWPGGPCILAFIPEEFRANWDKEFDWFIRANHLFDEEDVKVVISSISLQELEDIKTANNKDAEVKYSARKILATLNA